MIYFLKVDMLNQQERIQLNHHKTFQRTSNTLSANVICSIFGVSIDVVNDFKLPKNGCRSRVYKTNSNLYCVSTRYPRDLDGEWKLYRDQSFAKIYKTKLWVQQI
jgi:hypothetical protein